MTLHCAPVILLWLALPLFFLAFGCVYYTTRAGPIRTSHQTACVAVVLTLILIVIFELDLRRPEQSVIMRQVPHALICG